VAAALVLLLALPITTLATYPGSADGLLAIGSNVGGNFDIYTVLPNGQGIHRLTEDPLFDACPAWSADGKRLAWCHGVQAQTGIIDVWTMNANGTDKFQVTNLGGRSFFPDFSPDGTKIVFNSRPAGATNFDLFAVNPDGTGLVQLTTGPANEVNPAWSPDGNRIVFTSDSAVSGRSGHGRERAIRPSSRSTIPEGPGPRLSRTEPGSVRRGDRDIRVMNADGSDQHTVVGGPTDDFGHGRQTASRSRSPVR
jgi:TolB protein